MKYLTLEPQAKERSIFAAGAFGFASYPSRPLETIHRGYWIRLEGQRKALSLEEGLRRQAATEDTARVLISLYVRLNF